MAMIPANQPRKRKSNKRPSKGGNKSISKSSQSIHVRMGKEEERWRAESDLRTIQEAEVIKRDKQRLDKAKAIGRQQMEAIKKAIGE